MKKQSNLTAAVVVVGLLFGLAMVAAKVVPPPPGPPKPADATAQAKDPDGDEDGKRPAPPKPGTKDPKQSAANSEKIPPAPPKPTFNPNSIDVTPDYWKENKDGEKGVDEMNAKMTKAKAEEAAAAAARKKAEEEAKKNADKTGAKPATK